MNYDGHDLTAGERGFVERCREFSQTVVKELYIKYDRENVFATKIHQVAFEYDIMHSSIPKEYGGQGLSHVSLAFGGIEIAKICAPTSFSLGFNHGTMRPILMYGSESQKQQLVKRSIERREYLSWCMTEPETSGSNLFDIKTTAVKTKYGWEISGQKCMIGNGTVASTFLVLAQTIIEGESKGLSVFIVRKDESVHVTANIQKLGFRCLPTPTVTFNKTVIPAENVLYKIGFGTVVLLDALNFMRFGGGIVLTGLSSSAIRHATQFAYEREVFGGQLTSKSHVQVNIGSFLAELESLRILLFDIGYRIDHGKEFANQSASLKLLGSDLASRITNEAMLIWGWRGIDDSHPVQKLFRDAKTSLIYEGTNQLLAIKLFNDFLKRTVRNECAIS